MDPALIDLDGLIATARAYHAKVSDPVALRDQLAAQLGGVAEVVAEHFNALIRKGVPPDLAASLVTQLHYALITAGGES